MMDSRESIRPRQADDGQAADGQKGLSRQFFELCEEPETVGGHYVFVVADLRGAKFAYITARVLSQKFWSARPKFSLENMVHLCKNWSGLKKLVLRLLSWNITRPAVQQRAALATLSTHLEKS